jgi:AmmeMemoRadiSam system protein B
MESYTRRPAVAGAFYPDEPDELKSMIAGFLGKAGNVKIEGRLRALVEPHAGYVYSGPVAAFGYKLLAAMARQPSRIIILGPSHYAGFFGAAEAGANAWQTPLGIVKAGSLAQEIGKTDVIKTIPEAHAQEHCIEVQLPFLQSAMKRDFTIYPLLCGEVSPSVLAEIVLKAVDKETLVIASSDLSHYNPYERAKRLDSICNKAVPTLDIPTMEDSGDACGRTGILTLMHMAKKMKWKGKMLDYRNSGDTAGPKDAVVGYGCYAFCEEK